MEGWLSSLRVHTALEEDWSTVPRTITTTGKSTYACGCGCACVCVVLMPLAFVSTWIYAHTSTQLKKFKMLKNKTVLLPRRLVLMVELGQMPHGV